MIWIGRTSSLPAAGMILSAGREITASGVAGTGLPIRGITGLGPVTHVFQARTQSYGWPACAGSDTIMVAHDEWLAAFEPIISKQALLSDRAMQGGVQFHQLVHHLRRQWLVRK
jgi:hypothetical protein